MWLHAMKGIPNLRFSRADGAITTTHNVTSCARNKLCQPTDRSNQETDVDEEKNDGRVTVQRLPIKCERQL